MMRAKKGKTPEYLNNPGAKGHLKTRQNKGLSASLFYQSPPGNYQSTRTKGQK